MTSRTSKRFRSALGQLPQRIRRQAREAYALFARNPRHPSLRFKRVHPTLPIYSVRVTRDYRAVGVLRSDRIVWFWIGLHSEYERLLSQL